MNWCNKKKVHCRKYLPLPRRMFFFRGFLNLSAMPLLPSIDPALRGLSAKGRGGWVTSS
jgi:hypothetical protein